MNVIRAWTNVKVKRTCEDESPFLLMDLGAFFRLQSQGAVNVDCFSTVVLCAAVQVRHQLLLRHRDQRKARYVDE